MRHGRRRRPGWYENPRGILANPNPGRFETAALVGDDLDEEGQQTTPDNDPDQYLWADPQQPDTDPIDARDPGDGADDESEDDEGSDTEGVKSVVSPPARVRSTDARRGLPQAIRSLVSHAGQVFSDVSTRALSARMRQRGIALAIIVTTDGRVKVCQ